MMSFVSTGRIKFPLGRCNRATHIEGTSMEDPQETRGAKLLPPRGQCTLPGICGSLSEGGHRERDAWGPGFLRLAESMREE